MNAQIKHNLLRAENFARNFALVALTIIGIAVPSEAKAAPAAPSPLIGQGNLVGPEGINLEGAITHAFGELQTATPQRVQTSLRALEIKECGDTEEFGYETVVDMRISVVGSCFRGNIAYSAIIGFEEIELSSATDVVRVKDGKLRVSSSEEVYDTGEPAEGTNTHSFRLVFWGRDNLAYYWAKLPVPSGVTLIENDKNCHAKLVDNNRWLQLGTTAAGPMGCTNHPPTNNS